MDSTRNVDARFIGLAGIAGVAGGAVMAMWTMIYSAATNNGFWTPLNVCMASFIYRSDAEMMMKDIMKHPGMPMDMPVEPSHLVAGFFVHMTFSVVVGISFALVLLFATRLLRLPLLTTWYGYAAAAMIGALILFALMEYVILPPPIGANPVIPDMTPRGAFMIGHLLYGAVYGLVAFALLRPTLPEPGFRRVAA